MAGGGTKSRKLVSYAKYGYMFILPFFLVYGFFMVWPFINTVLLSFKGNGSKVNEWVGFQNYSWLLFGDKSGGQFATGKVHHDAFFDGFGTTIILWAGNFLIQIVLSLLLAVWFSDVRIKIKGTGFFKVVMYLPNIIMAASVAAMFLMIFGNSKYGVINSLAINNGWIQEPIAFMSDKWIVRILVMFIQAWLWFGNTMLLLLSGIFGIDPSIYEAAAIDGSSGASTFFRITMPILKPIFLYVVVTSLIGGLQMFDIPYLMHTGNDPNDYLNTVATYIYKHFHKFNNFGFSAAASILLFIVTVLLGMIVMRFNTDSTASKKKRNK